MVYIYNSVCVPLNHLFITAKLLGSRLLLNICSVPVSGAYGILNSRNLMKIMECISKCSIDEMNSLTLQGGKTKRSAKNIAKEAHSDESEVGDDDHDENAKDLRSSRTTTLQHINKLTLKNVVRDCKKLSGLYVSR